MCGRYSFVSDLDLLIEYFGLDNVTLEWKPRYNIAPTQQVPAIISDRAGARRLGLLRWGLVPSWAQEISIGVRMINARSETLTEKPAFSPLLARKRCLIPADGFYEWQRRADGSKQPMRIRLTERPLFAFAGLYDTWQSPTGEKVHTCTIITTAPNRLMADIHDRMPAILLQEDEKRWLDPELSNPVEILSMLAPYPSERMEAYNVSALVGNPRNDSPACIEAL